MAIPERLGPYTIQRLLGSGAMGTVYFGYRDQPSQPLAIKVLSADVARDGEGLKRFQREAEIVSTLRHRNIIGVVDRGCDNGQHYIVMEYIEGRDLQAQLDEHEFPDWRTSVRLTLSILNALQYAHDNGVVHRDIKPANILIDEQGEVVLTDFGVAHFNEGTRLTTAGTLIGTPEYMAPEMFEDGEVDSKVDVYATSIILYELLTHTHPFRGGTLTETIKSVLFKPIPRLETVNPEIPAPLSDIVLRGLARKPDARPTAAVLARQLQAFLSQSESEAAPETAPMGTLPEPEPESPKAEEIMGVLLITQANEDTKSRLSSKLRGSGAQALQWVQDEAIVLFASPAAALQCAGTVRQEFSYALPTMRMVLVAGTFEPDPVYARAHPELGDFACATVELAHAMLPGCPPGQLRVRSQSLSGAPDSLQFREVGPDLYELDQAPVAPPPAEEPEPEPEPVPDRPLSLAERLGDSAPKRKPQFVPTSDSRIRTMPVAKQEPKKRSPLIPLVILVVLLMGFFYWRSNQVGRVILQCSPNKVEVKVPDTNDRFKVERGNPITLPAGEHTLVVWANGYKPSQQKVTVETDKDVTITVKLEKAKKKPGKKPK